MNDINLVLVVLKTSLISKKGHCLVKPKNPKMAFKILRLLYTEGFILSYIYDIYTKSIIIYHNYYKNKPIINILNIYQKSSFNVYLKYEDLISIHKFGIELLILSTSKGIKPHYMCIKERLGGRLICYIR